MEHLFTFVPPARAFNFGDDPSLPLFAGATLAIGAIATMAHLIVSSVRHRSYDFAVLKSLGFVRAQVRAAVFWQATTISIVALILGLPCGIVAGRWAWTALADRVGVIPQPTTPIVSLVLMVVAIIATTNLVAATPAVVASRMHPTKQLGSE
jgi:ABC-type antimicrobial peptide transport system permease subunit